MRQNSFSATRCARVCAVFFAGALAGLLVAGNSLAANVPAGVSPEPAAQPAPPPTELVPTGVRTLLGPPVTVAPDDSVFEVDAPDLLSANQVLDMAERARSITASFFTWPEKPPTRIQIQLIPTSKVDFAAPYVIKPGENGQPTVLVRWNADTQFSDICRAISSVTLQNIVSWNVGAAVAGQVPDWLKFAFGALLEVSLKQAMADSLSEQAQRFPMLAMRQIMTAHNPTGQDVSILAVNAYWLTLFLNSQCANHNVSHGLFDALATGTDPAPLLGTAFSGQFEDERDLELWWQIGYRDELAALGAPIQTFAQTRAVLDDLERVQIIGSNGPELIRLDQAWAHHADKAFRETIAQTLVHQHTAPGHANPAYKNAVVSVLQALENLRGNSEKDFRNAWKVYQDDRAAGEAIEKTVNAALAEGK